MQTILNDFLTSINTGIGNAIAWLAGVLSFSVPLLFFMVRRANALRELAILRKGTFRRNPPPDFTIPRKPKSGVLDLLQVQKAGDMVRFGIIPYIDNAHALIAQKLGWFAEAGIHVQFQQVEQDNVMDGLASGELDIAAACPCTLVELGSFPRNTTIQAFAFSDLFQGYALMAPQRWTLRSPRRLRTYNYFSHTEAIKRIVKQIKGHRITHCKDSGVYTFLGRMFTEAGCHDNDFDRIVVPEEATIDKLIKGEADLQVGGVPSRLILERLGYRSIVTSEDIISAGMQFF